MLYEKSGKTWHAEQRSLSGGSKLTEQTFLIRLIRLCFMSLNYFTMEKFISVPLCVNEKICLGWGGGEGGTVLPP